MATIITKNSSTASSVPLAAQLVQGELAVNVTDKRLFTENNGGTVVELGTNPSTLVVASGATIQGLTVGRGAGAFSDNTAAGRNALASNTSGNYNTVVGSTAGGLNTTGAGNLFVGFQAGNKNTTGSGNSFVGGVNALGAGYNNTTGSSNTAFGADALAANTTASNNTAVGYQAGYSNTTGQANVLLGKTAGFTNSTGNNNIYIGSGRVGSQDPAGYYATGSNNTFVGGAAGATITTGSSNTILGQYNGNQGGLDIRTASNYIVLSDGDGNPRGVFDNSGNYMVGTTSVSTITGEATAKFQAAGNAVFGNAVASTNLTVTLNGVVNKASRIGFAESGGIKWLIGNGAASENGVFEVYSNTTGTGVQLGRNATSWSAASDERLKTTLVPFENAAAKVAALRAGTARYLTDMDSMSRSFLSAQSVQAVLPEAVDANTDEQATLSLRYTDVIPLLVAAIQELKAEVDSLKAQINGASV